MSITRAKMLEKFERITAHMSGAALTCVYQGDTFTGTRASLEFDQVSTYYGIVSDYQFSVYVKATDLVTRVETNKKIVVSGGDIGGEETTMRVMGKGIDPTGAFIRLDLKPEFGA